jgi:hypothetical protein
MNKNLKIIKSFEANNFFNRNLYFYKNTVDKNNSEAYRIKDLITINNLKSKSILEIGCATGIRLNQYQEILNSKINYGIDLSLKAINFGIKKEEKSAKIFLRKKII